MTKKENFAELRTLAVANGRNDLVEFIDHEVELIVKKNTYKSTKPTKNQVENEKLKDAILDVMVEPMTATQVAEKIGVSVNKASALLTQLKEDNSVIRTIGEKRKAYFSKA